MGQLPRLVECGGRLGLALMDVGGSRAPALMDAGCVRHGWQAKFMSLQVEIVPAQGEISVGESKFFQCQVVGDAKEIEWYAPSGEKILPNRQDISVSAIDESSSTLTIYNANVDNAGIYKCVAKSGDKQAEGTVTVKIFQKITFKNAPTPQEFNEGDDADIICDVISSPPPNIYWKYKNVAIQMEKDVRFKVLSNNHLQIRGIKKTDEGPYTCEGRIMARGEVDLRIINVVVNVLPSIRTRQSELNATADTGNSVTLACDADGYPEPIVTWTRNGVVLQSNEKYQLNEDGSELVIKDVKKLDEGDYRCIAKNKAGEKSEEVSLNVFVQPKITFLENQTASELEEQITLTCEATGDPTPSIVWSFGRRVFTEGEQASWTRPEKHKSLDGNVVVRSDARVSSLTLKYVQFTDAGQYLCTARNSIGQDIQSMYLEVRYAPKLQGAITVYTWEGNPANISCEVLAHPSASVVWFRDSQPLPGPNTTNIKVYSSPAVSYLEITPDSQNDFGSYNCTASNAIGTESKEFLLIQADVPSAPSIELVEPYSSTALVQFEEPDSNGGVPVLRYKAQWRVPGQDWASKDYEAEDGQGVLIVGLKPETVYEVKISAINGKGEGDSSSPESFKTQPVRYTFTMSTESPTSIPSTSAFPKGEPNPPKLEAKLQSSGNALKVSWVKQDDGGSPIKHYLVRYKAKQGSEWKPEIRLPNGSEYVVLSGLDWNTEYEVYVVAENQRGKSQPGMLSYRTSPQPTTIPGSVTSGSGLGTGAIVGILIVVFILLLVGVDVTCYFLNKCGVLMCIAVNFCGKSGPAAKTKDMEEGKAAFTKDESKEPIVEVRTEEERTPNHEGNGAAEPNETTPLTDPEHAADTASTVVDLLPSVTINSDPAPDSFATAQSSPATENSPLTSSTAPPVQPTSPKTAATASTSALHPASTQEPVPPLVDLSDAPGTVPTETPSVTQTLSSHPKPAGDNVKQSPPARPVQSTLAPSSQTARPPQSKDSDVEGGASQSPDAGLGRDVFDELSKPSDSLADSSTPTQDDGKVVVDEKSNADGADAKKTPSEVKMVPNEAAQTNGNESKA
ncbi:neural cell adhesion molecule 1a [Chanos chanos]|uniref:Neural cell adhesion molecule 1a n=1 Tax=Chanos chanos TaxID=29144 RepID=A0A6J2W644_CHACN|nr:neural cell adhesion molecule 1 [Chanos chanos]